MPHFVVIESYTRERIVEGASKEEVEQRTLAEPPPNADFEREHWLVEPVILCVDADERSAPKY
jgi:hypothetical protein